MLSRGFSFNCFTAKPKRIQNSISLLHLQNVKSFSVIFIFLQLKVPSSVTTSSITFNNNSNSRKHTKQFSKISDDYDLTKRCVAQE